VEADYLYENRVLVYASQVLSVGAKFFLCRGHLVLSFELLLGLFSIY
jgi:hypothetical protein